MIDQKTHPACFGNLETVFPMKEDGLRHTPENCMTCGCKTPCLKTAMNGAVGMGVKEEMLDRSYAAGVISFWSRWSQKKALNRKKEVG
jgi:hypothetical protein